MVEAACASNDGVTCAKAPKFSACHRRFQYQGHPPYLSFKRSSCPAMYSTSSHRFAGTKIDNCHRALESTTDHRPFAKGGLFTCNAITVADYCNHSQPSDRRAKEPISSHKSLYPALLLPFSAAVLGVREASQISLRGAILVPSNLRSDPSTRDL